MIEPSLRLAPDWQIYVYYKASPALLGQLLAKSHRLFEAVTCSPWGLGIDCQLMRRADSAEGGPVTLMEIYTPRSGTGSLSSMVSFFHDFRVLSDSIWKQLEGDAPARMVEVFESLSANRPEENSQCA